MGRVVSLAEAQTIRERLRNEGRRLVFTNGYFDLLHAGHVRYLTQARAQGDALLVAVNADAVARRQKDPRRPIQPEAARAEVVAALACVDYALLFEADTAQALVAELQPEVYVKGGDYTPDGDHAPPEAPVVRGYGGSVVILPFQDGHSTTGIIATILSRYCPPDSR